MSKLTQQSNHKCELHGYRRWLQQRKDCCALQGKSHKHIGPHLLDTGRTQTSRPRCPERSKPYSLNSARVHHLRTGGLDRKLNPNIPNTCRWCCNVAKSQTVELVSVRPTSTRASDPTVCPICGLRCSDRQNGAIHMQRTHGVQYEQGKRRLKFPRGDGGGFQFGPPTSRTAAKHRNTANRCGYYYVSLLDLREDLQIEDLANKAQRDRTPGCSTTARNNRKPRGK